MQNSASLEKEQSQTNPEQLLVKNESISQKYDKKFEEYVLYKDRSVIDGITYQLSSGYAKTKIDKRLLTQKIASIAREFQFAMSRIVLRANIQLPDDVRPLIFPNQYGHKQMVGRDCGQARIQQDFGFQENLAKALKGLTDKLDNFGKARSADFANETTQVLKRKLELAEERNEREWNRDKREEVILTQRAQEVDLKIKDLQLKYQQTKMMYEDSIIKRQVAQQKQLQARLRHIDQINEELQKTIDMQEKTRTLLRDLQTKCHLVGMMNAYYCNCNLTSDYEVTEEIWHKSHDCASAQEMETEWIRLRNQAAYYEQRYSTLKFEETNFASEMEDAVTRLAKKTNRAQEEVAALEAIDEDEQMETFNTQVDKKKKKSRGKKARGQLALTKA